LGIDWKAPRKHRCACIITQQRLRRTRIQPRQLRNLIERFAEGYKTRSGRIAPRRWFARLELAVNVDDIPLVLLQIAVKCDRTEKRSVVAKLAKTWVEISLKISSVLWAGLSAPSPRIAASLHFLSLREIIKFGITGRNQRLVRVIIEYQPERNHFDLRLSILFFRELALTAKHWGLSPALLYRTKNDAGLWS